MADFGTPGDLWHQFDSQGHPLNAESGLVSTPIPGVAGYGTAAEMAKTAYANTLARLNQQRSSTLRQYGYKADIAPDTGVLKNMTVDPGNPYGGFQQMLSSHATLANQARDSAISRGLGHGGLAAQGESQLKHQFGGDASSLGQALTDALAAFQDQQTQAAYQRDMALWQAEQAAAQQAIADGLFNMADFSGLEYPDYGSGQDPATGFLSDPNAARTFAQPPGYNPQGYVYGGASPKVAQAIVNKSLAQAKPSAKAPTQYVNGGATPAVAKAIAAAAPAPAPKPTPAPKPAPAPAPKPAAKKPTIMAFK